MRKLAAGLALLLGALPLVPRVAGAQADKAVVVTVGDDSATVDQVQSRLDKVPAFQLHTFGNTPDEIRHGFVEKVVIPEMLYAAEAKRRKLDQTPRVQDQLLGILSSAMTDAIHDALPAVSDAEIGAYYTENATRFNTPERIRIWRILLADKAQAEQIIKDVKGANGATLWEALAREKSLDKATAMRQGNLGFVQPDGRTEEPRVRVEPGIYAAAAQVKDGDVVEQPVKEGDNWAVLWRRGSMPAVHRTEQQEAPSIRQILLRKRMSDTVTALLKKLRDQRVGDVNYTLLDFVDVDSVGDISSKSRPGVVPRERHRGQPVPERHEQGYR